jgi:hypothetical protein
MEMSFKKSLDWVLIGLAISAIAAIILFTSPMAIRIGVSTASLFIVLIGGPMLERLMVKKIQKRNGRRQKNDDYQD